MKRFFSSLVIFITVLSHVAVTYASVTVTVNGTNYTIPQKNEKGWGDNVTSWIQAISANTVQPTGGTFLLSADLDFGANFGLKSLYYKTRSTNVASLGNFRLATTESIAWRNNANSGNLLLSTNAADQLLWNADPIVARTTTDTLTNKTIAAGSNTITGLTNTNLSGAAALTNANLNTMAAHTYKGNNTGAGSTPLDLTNTQVLADVSPLTTKGDLPTFSTLNTRQPVGNNGQALVADSSQATGIRWGSVAGGGSKNYLATVTASTASGVANPGNGDFELGSTSGFALGNVTLTNNFPSGVPTFGSGASVNLSLSTVTSSQLSGSTSMGYVSSAATTAGNFVASSPFFIDSSDQAKVLTFKMSYQAFSGATNINFSGTSANSYAIAIYDVTNASWIQPAGVYNFTQSSGVGIATGTFQTTTNSTNYRIVVYNANATAGAATLYLDDISVGPQVSPIGPVVTDWVAYTPTFSAGFGTPTSVLFYSRRVGDTLEVNGRFTAGTVAASTATITVGYNGANGNVTIDTSKVGGSGIVGTAQGSLVSTTHFGLYALAPASNATTIGFSEQNSASTAFGSGAQNGTVITASGAAFGFQAVVPIVGWSSNTTQSSDTDTRVVAAQNLIESGVTSDATTPIIFATKGFDTHGSYSIVTGKYTVPVSGYYVVGTSVAVTTAGQNLTIYKNGTATVQLGTPTASSYNGNTGIIQANAGDLLDVRFSSGSATTLTTTTQTLTIYRLSGPAVVAATESVNMSYTDTSGAAIGTSAATYTFATKNFDSHNAYSGGVYTCPVSGKYQVMASLFSGGVTLTTAQSFNIFIIKNSTTMQQYSVNGNGASTIAYAANTSIIVSCLAGETLSVKASSGVATTTNNGSGLNNLSISRVGN